MVEMLVVIAIIGILASIIIRNLNMSRNFAHDASVMTSMESIRSHAQIFHTDHGYSFNDGTNSLCNDAQIMILRQAASDETGHATTCNADADSFAVWVELRATANYFCVDSKSFSGQKDPSAFSNPLATTCP